LSWAPRCRARGRRAWGDAVVSSPGSSCLGRRRWLEPGDIVLGAVVLSPGQSCLRPRRRLEPGVVVFGATPSCSRREPSCLRGQRTSTTLITWITHLDLYSIYLRPSPPPSTRYVVGGIMLVEVIVCRYCSGKKSWAHIGAHCILNLTQPQ
jgi:hypothetical protein